MPVSAHRSLQTLFDVTHIINTGIAGSLDAQIDIGDIVVSTDVLQHDMDVRVFGYPLGEIPQLGTLSFRRTREWHPLPGACARKSTPK